MRKRQRIYSQEMGKLVPPLLQSSLLGMQTRLHFVMSVLHQWVVHVDEYVVEDEGKLAHACEARGRVRCCGRILPVIGLSRPKGCPQVVFRRVID